MAKTSEIIEVVSERDNGGIAIRRIEANLGLLSTGADPDQVDAVLVELAKRHNILSMATLTGASGWPSAIYFFTQSKDN